MPYRVSGRQMEQRTLLNAVISSTFCHWHDNFTLIHLEQEELDGSMTFRAYESAPKGD